MRRPLLLEIGIVLVSLGLGVLAFYLGVLGRCYGAGVAIVFGIAGLGPLIAAGVAHSLRARGAR